MEKESLVEKDGYRSTGDRQTWPLCLPPFAVIYDRSFFFCQKWCCALFPSSFPLSNLSAQLKHSFAAGERKREEEEENLLQPPFQSLAGRRGLREGRENFPK